MEPYAVLGVGPDDDFETIKAAYRRLVRDNHPDVARDKVVATVRMAQINDAWRLIGDPARRAAFDSRVRLDAIERANRQREQLERDAKERLQAERARLDAQRRQRNDHEKHDRTRHARPSARSVAASKNHSISSRKSSASGAHSQKKPRDLQSVSREKRLSDKLVVAKQLMVREGRSAEAMAICRSVLMSDGRNIAARELIGDIYIRQGRIERALMMFDQAVQLAPTDTMLRRKRDILQKTQETRKAAARIEKPLKPPTLWGRLRASIRLGKK